jgi:hypothetical protein
MTFSWINNVGQYDEGEIIRGVIRNTVSPLLTLLVLADQPRELTVAARP